jgi:hypothetical protein
MASNYKVDNICLNCSRKSSNGIICDSMFFCSSDCYEKQKRVRFGKVHFVDYEHHSDSVSMRPSSASRRPSNTYSNSSPRSLHVYQQNPRMLLNPTPTPINKQCNYCFTQYDINLHAGIPYGRMWFCCQDHLNLANPRPKHVMVPSIGPFGHPIQLAGPIIGHPGQIIMGRSGIIGPVIGPFMGPVMGPFIGPPF